VDLDGLDEESRLQQDLELDSLDFLRLLEAIDESTGVDIPERDYTAVATVKSLIDYLTSRG
jgi:acyl carrier protein